MVSQKYVELALNILGSTTAGFFISGFALQLFRNWFLTRFLSIFGLTYFARVKELYANLGNQLSYSMGELHCQYGAIYRTYNGRTYISNDDRTLKKVRSDITKCIFDATPFPRKFDKYPEFQVIFKWVMSYPSFTEFVVAQLPTTTVLESKAKTFFIAKNISSFFIMKVRDDEGNLYGFVIYAWASIKKAPRNLGGQFAALDEETFKIAISDRADLLQTRYIKMRETLVSNRDLITNYLTTLVDLLLSEKIRSLKARIFRGKRKKR